MEASSLPNLNRETTSYHNFFTFFQDPNHHDDTTLHKRQKIDHSQVSEPSETSPPFKDILSPLVSFNGSNENHYPVGGYFYEWDQNQMDQTLPRLPPSPTRSSDTDDSVGSNPFSGNVGARSEGLYVTQLRGDQTIPSMSSVGSKVLDTISAQVPVFLLERTSNSIDDGHAWRKYGQKVILNYNYPSDRTRDSDDDDDDDDDDDQDSDDDVAASANNLRRAIRYGIYGNDDIEEAHGSLERDDEDVYFDDESAEVVISCLRLGPDSGPLFTNSNWFAFGDDSTDEKINLSK